ncbi:MAG: riboflavin synthase [Planctomycetota bacterium]
MFTGLVQAVGEVVAATRSESGRRLVIDLGGWPHRPEAGDSIAIDGCCLTAAQAPDGTRLAFDAVPETLSRTTLEDLAPGSRVHLEHAVTASTLMGGHFVQGHVDGVAGVDSISTADGWRVRLSPPSELMAYLAPKGSVCVAGVSLTIAEVSVAGGWFEVALIPTTLELTTLGDLAVGSSVNLEADMLAKSAVHYLTHFARRG